MKKTIVLTLLFMTYFSLVVQAQEPQLWIEGQGSNPTIFEHGFEDSTLNVFTTSANFPWTIVNTDASEGSFSTKAANAPLPSSSSLFLSINVPTDHDANLTFYTRTSGGGTRIFLVDSVQVFDLTSQAQWSKFEHPFSPGTYALEWRYSGTKKLNLDDVQLTLQSNAVVRIQDGNQANGKILTSDQHGNASWQAIPTIIDIDTSDQSGIQVIFDNVSGNSICDYDSMSNDSIGLLTINARKIGILSQCSNIGLASFDATTDGFQSIRSGDNGFLSLYAEKNGFVSQNSTLNGFRSISAGGDAFGAANSTAIGFVSEFAGSDGFVSLFSTLDGFSSSGSGNHGFYAANSGDDGFVSIASTDDGFVSNNSGSDGFYATNSGANGYVSIASSNDGFVSTNSGGDGFVSAQAGTFGVVSGGSGSHGFLANGSGVNGVHITGSGGAGIYSLSNVGDEGYFSGTVTVTGNLSKGGGSFKIDHPLDPENKYLYHSFVESPDMMNVYNGNVITDEHGYVTISMPAYFEALNRDFRYQLTVIGVFAQAIVKQELQDGQFIIQTDQPNIKVSWQITGIRQDPYANQNRIEVEVEKEEKFKGQYIHHEAYEMPFERGYDYIKLGKKTLEELNTSGLENKLLLRNQTNTTKISH